MQKLNAILHGMEMLADGILAFEFRPADGSEWPAPTPGAHIDVHLPNGLVRSYSLINQPGYSTGYLIAVNREVSGSGGSLYMHDVLRVGQLLQLSEPRNNFPLRQSSSPAVFFAGGIGVTPIWSMVQQLAKTGAPWCVHYSARTRTGAAFVEELLVLASQSNGEVHLNFDGGARERMLDLRAIVASSAPGSDFYCCGPAAMLRAFTGACKDLDQDKVHFEYFSAPAAAPAEHGANDAFSVVLSKSEKVVEVAPDSTILEALLAAGVDAPYSCMGGICRACETSVIAGMPDHRDFVFSEAEKIANDKIIICCSRSKSRELVLDL